MNARRPLGERIAQHCRIDPDSGCWLWTGAVDRQGYGSIRTGYIVEGTRRQTTAHRVSYEHHVGPIPEGLQLDHLCRNRACINPAHLEPVTPQTNVLRGDTVTARNAAKESCPTCGGDYSVRQWAGGRTARICKLCKNAKETRRRRQTRMADA